MAQNEIQTIDLLGSPSGGTFSIDLGGQSTSAIAYNATSATVESAIEALPAVGSGNVSCSGGPLPGTAITVEFVSGLAETNIVEMDIDPSNLTGGSISASVSENTKGVAAAWDISTSSGTGKFEDLETLLGVHSVSGIAFKPDGTKLYAASGAYVYEMSLAAAWDLDDTVTYSGNYGYVAPQILSGRNLLFNSDGTKLFIAGNAFAIREFSLSTPWDITTISYTTSATPPVKAVGLCANSDGTRFFLCDGSGTVAQMDLSTGWDMTTASNPSKSFSTNSEAIYTNGLAYGLSGSKIYALGTYDNTAYEYDLSTADDASTGSYSGNSHTFWFWPDDKFQSLRDMVFKPDGKTMFLLGLRQNYPNQEYSVEEFAVSGTGSNETQDVSVAGSPSYGTFELSYGGNTATVDYDSTAAELEDALEALSSVGTNNVSGTGGPLPGTAVSVTFQNGLGSEDVDLMTVNDSKLQYKVVTTQDGAPTPTQASASWSAGPFVYSAIDAVASASWTSGDVTASGNLEQATGTWSASSLQSPGIPSSNLPTAQWSSGTVTSAVTTHATATWSAGTPLLPGVFSGPAIAKWRAVQFAALPDNPVIASWSTSEIELDNNPVNVPTAAWSSSNAIATAVVDGDPTATWSTGELTTDLNLGLPTAAWSSATLSPSLSQPSTQWTVPGSIGVRLISAPAYVGTTTFRIIDQNLQVVSLEGESVTIPSLTSGSLTIPQFTGQSIAAPGLTSGSLIS